MQRESTGQNKAQQVENLPSLVKSFSELTSQTRL